MERTYYILRNNQQEGPFTRQEIVQMALPDHTLLWSEGWTRWQPLSEVGDFVSPQGAADLPPAIPGMDSAESVRKYHLANLREPIGIFTLEELRRDPSPLKQAKWVWYQGLAEWIALDQVPEIEALLASQCEEGSATPPPVRPSVATPPFYRGGANFSQGPSSSNPMGAGAGFQGRVSAPEPSLWSCFVGWLTTRFAQFSGRARRREFWGFVLYSLIFSYLVQFVSSLFVFPIFLSDVFEERLFDAYMSGGVIDMYGEIFSNPGFITSYGLLTLVSLFFLIPSLAVSVRRLHDIGKSGWFLLITLIPVVGSIIFIIYAAQEGVRRPNKYGEDPKAPQTPN